MVCICNLITAPSYVTLKNCMVESKVQRSDLWKWGNEGSHNGNPEFGHILECLNSGWARIKWDCGEEGKFRIHPKGEYDLYFAECKYFLLSL